MSETPNFKTFSSNKFKLPGYTRPNFRYTPKSSKKLHSKYATFSNSAKSKNAQLPCDISTSYFINMHDDSGNFNTTNDLNQTEKNVDLENVELNKSKENDNDFQIGITQKYINAQNASEDISLKKESQIENTIIDQEIISHSPSCDKTINIKSSLNCQASTPNVQYHSDQYMSPLPQFEKKQKLPNTVANSRQYDSNIIKSYSPTRGQNSNSAKQSSRRVKFHLPKEPVDKRALKNLGFSPEYLEYPSDATICLFSKNPSLKQYVRDELNKDVDSRIELYNQEKERILAERSEEEEEAETNALSDKEAILDSRLAIHTEQMKRLFIKQKRALVLKIYQALSSKYRQEEKMRNNELLKSRVLERQQQLFEKHKMDEENAIKRKEFIQEAEMKRQEKLKEYIQKELNRDEKFKQKKEEEKKFREKKKIEFDYMMQERLEQHAEIQKQKEEIKRKQLNQKLERIKEREEQIKKLKLQKQIEFKKKIESNLNEHTQLIHGIEDEKQKKIDTLRKKLDERNIRLEKTLKELNDKKIQEREEKKNKNEEKLKRAQISKEIIENERIASKDKEIYKIRSKIAEDKMQEIQEARDKKHIQSLENDRLISERLQFLEEEKMKKRDQQRKDYYEKDKISAEKIAAQRKKDAEEREFEILKEKIAMSRRQFSILVRDRQKQYRNEDIQLAMKMRLEAFKNEESKQKELELQLLQKTDILIAESDYIIHKFDDEISSAKTEKQLRCLAKKYGIDFDSIDEKAKNPRSRHSIADLINEECK